MKSVPSTLFALAVLMNTCVAADRNFQQSGVASWFGSENHKSTSGETYNAAAMTAAHRTLPLGSMVKVTNLSNNRAVVVRINDRGPFCKKRVIDVSKAAARELQMTQAGSARVKLELVAKN